jgi:hypothetical protein
MQIPPMAVRSSSGVNRERVEVNCSLHPAQLEFLADWRRQKKGRHAEEEILGSGDDRGAEANGSEAGRGIGGARVRRVEACYPCLESESGRMSVSEAQGLRQLEDKN